MENKIDVIKVEKFSASIYVGLRVWGADTFYPIAAVEDICQEFCDDIELCVTVIPAKYVYTDGFEQGAIVGIFNYPRFQKSTKTLENRALLLATELMLKLEKERITIDFPSHTIMLTTSK